MAEAKQHSINLTVSCKTFAYKLIEKTVSLT